MVKPSQKISKSSQANASGKSGNQAAAGMQANPEQIRQVLTSPEGQALLRLLQSDGGAGIRAASAALQGGDMEAAKAALTPLLEGTDAEDLTQRIEAQL